MNKITLKIPLRITFATLIIAGLYTRTHWFTFQHTGPSPLTTLATAMTNIGLINNGPDTTGAIPAHTNTCNLPITVAMIALDGSEDARFNPIANPGTLSTYIYLGHQSATPTHLTYIAAYLTANLQALAGLRATKVPTKAVLVIAPKPCPTLQSLPLTTLSP